MRERHVPANLQRIDRPLRRAANDRRNHRSGRVRGRRAPAWRPTGTTARPGEPDVGTDFTRLATRHAFGDSWTRPGLDTRSRALISVTIAAVLGTHEPLRGQLRIALNSGVTKEEIVELFIHVEAYAGAARAFDSYQVAKDVFAETAE